MPIAEYFKPGSDFPEFAESAIHPMRLGTGQEDAKVQIETGTISVRAIVLDRNLPGWLKPPRRTARVFHAVNGQVQFKENRAYLSQACRFSGLKDRIVIILDASDLSEAAHNDVRKGDRENIRAPEIGQLYRDSVTRIILGSDYLKQLQRLIAHEETEKLAEESQVNLFQNLIDTDPSIGQLLPGGDMVTLPGDFGRSHVDVVYEGKYSPTFLDIIARSMERDGAEIAIDGSRVVAFKTDVVNDYLTRPDNCGRVFTYGLQDKFSYTTSLRNGRLTALTFRSVADRVSVGDEVVFSVNYDNAHFQRFLIQERDDNRKKLITSQYRLGMLVLMLGFEDAYSRMEQSELKTSLEENIDEIRQLAAQGAATVVMSIAKTLPTIVNPDAVADPDDA